MKADMIAINEQLVRLALETSLRVALSPCLSLQGDSGGPLVCNCEAQGIAAYTAEACTDPIYPQVYTRISAFLPWMKKVMKGQDSEP